MPETTQKRRNRVFKSLHKPLTYMGIERTLFFFVAVSAVGMFNLFNSIIGGIIVFIGGCIFGHWVTNSDPAFLRILGRSEKFKQRYDAAKQVVPNVEVRYCSILLKSSSPGRKRTPLALTSISTGSGMRRRFLPRAAILAWC
jgi:type IV secretory pathway TrbD component